MRKKKKNDGEKKRTDTDFNRAYLELLWEFSKLDRPNYHEAGTRELHIIQYLNWVRRKNAEMS